MTISMMGILDPMITPVDQLVLEACAVFILVLYGAEEQLTTSSEKYQGGLKVRQSFCSYTDDTENTEAFP